MGGQNSLSDLAQYSEYDTKICKNYVGKTEDSKLPIAINLIIQSLPRLTLLFNFKVSIQLWIFSRCIKKYCALAYSFFDRYGNRAGNTLTPLK